MQNTLIDNSENLKLVDTLKKLINIPEITNIDIATGYWDIPGTQLLVNELHNFLKRAGTKLRLLIGKDPYVFAKYINNPKYKDASYPQDFIKTDINDLDVKKEYVPAVQLLLEFCTEQTVGKNDSKIEMKIFSTSEDKEEQFLHSKCYIFYGKGTAFGVIGSSNFTEKGLQGNAELDYLETVPQIISAKPDGINLSKGHIAWFNEKWALSSDWTKEFLEEILKKAPIAKVKPQQLYGSDVLTPYECYIKLLQDKFGMVTDSDFKSILTSYLPESIKPLEYQLNAVQQCYSFMLQHGGFVLGDVVGLGKTIVGILLIRYYIDVSSKLERNDKVLIIVPPAIRSSWKDTIKKFDKKQTDKIEEHVTFITTGSINHLFDEDEVDSEFEPEDVNDAEDYEDSVDDETEISTPDRETAEKNLSKKYKKFSQETTNYGLIIIDESHKFRNSTTEMYIALTEYLESVNARTGYYPFIGLLSATFQNNNPRDIQNQIYLFEHEPKNSSFEKVEGRNLDHFFSEINRRYATLIHAKTNHTGIDQVCFADSDKKKNKDALIKLSKEVREKVLSDILVRRTRTDLKKHYKENMNFPTVHGPENLYYTMDKKLALLFNDTMNIIAPKMIDGQLFEDGLGYYRYRATMFLDAKYDNVYSGRNMTAQRSSNQLARIMQILLVKRLESSFAAFKESLLNFQRYTQNMITMWENNTIFICPQIDINKELNIKEKQKKYPEKIITLETCFEDIRKKIEKLNREGNNEKGQNAEYIRSDFITKLEKNKSYIDFLKEDMNKINDLAERWNENDYDPKFDRFKAALRETSGLFCKERNKPHKLVIFSEAISTVNSLSRAVANITGKKPLVITAANRDDMEEIIKENFDANCDKEKRKNDYDVVITTEVLAEGINLHRANSILNYDTPWNATRLIQRIGRVNRIGSENTDIYVYNFYPSAQGDEQINLVQNAYTKLQSFHTMFGEDSKIYSEEEELCEGNFETLVDGEESPQEKYIAELKNYKDQNPERYAFIEKKEKAGEKAIEPISPETSGCSYFAIKVKNKSGCVYVEVKPDMGSDVVSYMDVFEKCHCKADCGSKELPATASEKIEAAINTYHVFETKLSKVKNNKSDITEILNKANNLVNRKQLDNDSMVLLGNAVKIIKKGNNILAKRLSYLLSEIELGQQRLIPVTKEEIADMIRKELGFIAASSNKIFGEAYIYAGFYQ